MNTTDRQVFSEVHGSVKISIFEKKKKKGGGQNGGKVKKRLRNVSRARYGRCCEYLHFDFKCFDFGLRPVVDHYCGQETGERERDKYAKRVRQHRVAPGK